MIARAALLISFVLVAPATADTELKPPNLRASSGGKTVTPTSGSYCRRDETHGICADAAYPLPIKQRLAIRPGGRIAIRSDEPLIDVDTCLETRKLKRFHCRDAAGAQRDWHVRLPRRLRGARRLSIFVRYPQGDADYELGLRIRCRSCGQQS